DAGALDMAEEAVAEARAFMRALDQAGDVGEHEFAAVDPDNAELRMERGEGVVGDLGLGRRHGGEKGGLARVRQADEARVRDQFQAQADRALDRRLPWVGMAWRAVGGGLEMRIAKAAIAALEQHDPLTDLGEIGEQVFAVLVEHLRADGDLEDDVLALGAGAVLAHAVAAGAGLEMLLVAIVDERVEPLHAFDDHIAAAAAVAAVRPAELNEFLATKR